MVRRPWTVHMRPQLPIRTFRVMTEAMASRRMRHTTQKILQYAAFFEYLSVNEASGWGGRCGCDG
jgi:hypothetical protein